MQIVIEIPIKQEDIDTLFYKIHGMSASEGLYDDAKPSERAKALGIVLDILKAIQNGTPLPKGHGRLIDADELANNDHLCEGISCAECPFEIFREHRCRLCDFIKNYPTIIDADYKYEAKVITRGNCMMCGEELTEGLFFCKECGAKANSSRSEEE